jgi:hypothetical protein
MALKVWHINKWNVDNVYWDPEGETIDGPTTDGHVEVVEKAEYDRLRGALEAIASHEEISYTSLTNAFRMYRKVIQQTAKEALDG